MSRGILVLGFAAASFCCNVAFCQEATTLRDAKAAEQKDYAAAQRLYAEHLKSNPDDTEAMKLRIATLFQGDAGGAERRCGRHTKSTGRRPELPELALAEGSTPSTAISCATPSFGPQQQSRRGRMSCPHGCCSPDGPCSTAN